MQTAYREMAHPLSPEITQSIPIARGMQVGFSPTEHATEWATLMAELSRYVPFRYRQASDLTFVVTDVWSMYVETPLQFGFNRLPDLGMERHPLVRDRRDRIRIRRYIEQYGEEVLESCSPQRPRNPKESLVQMLRIDEAGLRLRGDKDRMYDSFNRGILLLDFSDSYPITSEQLAECKDLSSPKTIVVVPKKRV